MAGLIPRPFIDELINTTDIVELIDSYVPLKKQGSSFVACCPFHHEKTPSFNVVAKRQFYYCFGCGASGNAISFIMNHLNQEFVDAVETLASRLGMDVPREGGTSYVKQNKSLYELMAEIATHYQKQLKQTPQAISYLKQRGLTGEAAKRYMLGYAPSGWHHLEQAFPKQAKTLIDAGMLIVKDDGSHYDRYRNRIMFPIHDRNGRIIGFGGRAIEADQKPKYLNSPETAIFQKNRELYGLHQIIQEKNHPNEVIVVEGYLDVIALAQHGIINAVAALGTATSAYHVQLLHKHFKRITFCFDGDNAGRQAAWRALENSFSQLNSGIQIQFSFLPDGEDPDSFVRQHGQHAFQTYITKSMNIEHFFLQTLTESIELNTAAGKSQLIQVAKPYLTKLSAGPFQSLLLEELARMTHITSDRIWEMCQVSHQAAKAIQTKKSVTRTPLRLAVSLLLQNPQLLNQQRHPIDKTLFDEEEHTVLIKLIDLIEQSPNCTTASLLEHWRQDELFATINHLAAWDHLITEESMLHEFNDTLRYLQKQGLERKIHQFLAKSRRGELSPTDRHELSKMLQLKTRYNTVKSSSSA
ncbi:DNA primase [Legionella sp. W05-934-2]|jgi:DNA primase|uniref:DNA primase n=1 Tax=Legionella sp. W05-934-2 TaxID=1198649 RepID=UPI003461A6B3